jgi:citrate lyase subunit beta/citryl-CoA lyase
MPVASPTSTAPRPRRSLLYVPADKPRAIDKARSLPIDGVILDLEDAVAPAAKDSARAAAIAAIDAGGFGPREVILRVNGLDTAWGHADLVAAATSGADAVLIPKVEGEDGVRAADRVLSEAGSPRGPALWVMMETPLGILNAGDIAAALAAPDRPRGALVMGTADLTKDLRATHMPLREPMVTALGLSLLAARAHGLAILDGVHLDLQDEDGLAASCRQGAALGFDGKTLIHPRQVEAANAAFSPDPEAVARARRIIDAHAEAMAAGRGVTVVDGRLVERLHVAEAERLVAQAEAIAGRQAAD